MTDLAATFRQHEILLTGANGFVGKVLLGMLLDRYPELKGLHVVIRPRKNLSAEARFEKEILQSPALRTLVEKRGVDFVRRKVIVWSADLSQAEGAIEPTHIEAWRGRVALIVHCAGLVEFFPSSGRILEGQRRLNRADRGAGSGDRRQTPPRFYLLRCWKDGGFG